MSFFILILDFFVIFIFLRGECNDQVYVILGDQGCWMGGEGNKICGFFRSEKMVDKILILVYVQLDMPGFLGWVGFLSSFYLMSEYSSNGPLGAFKGSNGKYYNYRSYLILKDGVVPSIFGDVQSEPSELCSQYFSALKDEIKGCYRKTNAKIQVVK